MDETKLINHFTHRHELKLYVEKDRHNKKNPWSSSRCYLCSKVDTHKGYGSRRREMFPTNDIFPIYGCKECSFFIHKFCAELPQELSHPFHPQHVLYLLERATLVNPSDDQQFQCNACGIRTSSNFIYHCFHCKFNLDFSCIQLKPSKICEAHTPQNRHQHLLFVCNTELRKEFELPCSFCQRPFYPVHEIYVCLHCRNLLHESCALPPEIIHPFHLEHPLAILPSKNKISHYKEFKCNACSGTHSVFHCSQCKFSLCLDCATLVPTTENSDTHDVSHSHPLIQCDNVKKIQHFKCASCESNILASNSIFVCLKCGILLEKSCAELPHEITNSFHPFHHLKLAHKEPCPFCKRLYCFHSSKCRGCLRELRCLFYICRECKFYLHPCCAMMTAPLVKSKAHYHLLSFLSTKPHEDFSLSCNSTNCQKRCEKDFFHCVECEFGLHLNCYPFLPPVIKHECHCDPLVLTRSRIKDMSDQDSDEEFYCHACEDIRDLDDPAYYCKDCHFVAHTHCVVSEILRRIETECAPSESSKALFEFHPPALLELPEAPSEHRPPAVPFPFDQFPGAPISELSGSLLEFVQLLVTTDQLQEAPSEFLQSNDPSEIIEVEHESFLTNTFSLLKSCIERLALLILKWIGLLTWAAWLANIITNLMSKE